MKKRPNLTRADAETLLDGGTVGAPRLEQLLRAASVPVADQSGEELAVAAFHRAGAVPAPPRRRFLAMKSALAAAVSAKVLAGVAVAAVASGGIALVAYHGAPTNPHGTPAVPTTSSTPSATPTPNMVGLCTAYQAGVSGSSGKATDSPAFQALITAAGGSDLVDGYCATVLATTPSASDHPTGKPTSLPTQATEHTTGKPTSLPTQANGHASDEPTSLPTEASSEPTSDPSARP